MFCQRCQHSLRNSEGIKCSGCEPRFHPRCTSPSDKDLEMEGGDRRRVWRCGQCKQPTSNCSAHLTFPNLGTLVNAVNAIAEKFELVNKIQLPKLNNDLSQIKLATDRIVRQNAEILNMFDEVKKGPGEMLSAQRSHRRRDLNLTPRKAEDGGGGGGGGGGSERGARYRTRSGPRPARRAYPLHKMFVMLNRSLYINRRRRKR